MKTIVKKLCTICLAIIVITNLTGCQSASTEEKVENNSITLTVDNYSDYLDVVATCNVTGYAPSEYSDAYGNALTSTLSVTGASSNFNYENVVVEIEVYGTYERSYKLMGRERYGDDKEFSEPLTVECNIAGNGSTSATTELSGCYTRDAFLNATYRITNISGTVTPI